MATSSTSHRFSISAATIFSGLQLVSAQSITCDPTSLSVCQLSLFVVDYSVTGSFNPGNVFQCYLSDENGSFAAPVALAAVLSTTSGQIAFYMPLNTLPGTGYRVRVDGTSPATQGAVNTSDITILDSPEAGSDQYFEICSNGAAFAMITLLPGADLGGLWLDPNWDPTSGIFVPGVSPQGCYTYVVIGSAPCPNDTAVICIDVPAAPNAGTAQFATLCTNSDTIMMFDYLGGSPDPGGSWTDPNATPHSGIFIPGVDLPGCYTYTVFGTSPCLNDSATLCIFVSQAADAGSDSTIYVCDTDPPFAMFNFLGGTPQLGGTWTAPGGPHSGVYVPGVDIDGCYLYTVQGVAPCTDSTAMLCVIDSCLSVGLDAERTVPTDMWISGGWNTDHPVVTIACEGSALLELIDASGRTLSRRTLRASSQDPQAIRMDLSPHGQGLYTLVLHHSASRNVLRLLNE